MTPDQHIVVTADGTPTLFSKQFNEHYHSTHGARQESLHVFIQMGLASLPFTPNPIPILEVGGGTLLNAHLSQNWLIQNNRSAIYHIAEAYPPHPQTLNAFWANAPLPQNWMNLYGQPAPIHSQALSLEHRYNKLEEAELPASFYSLVYFDAFAPSKQPELWTTQVFLKLADSMTQGAILVSYCAQGQFKRNLKQAGFRIESLPGPPGKREMTRATKA
jgi:tRNA U34 5-methylaminomethyl-2-thiouridine-forming methyltransferase MnmC